MVVGARNEGGVQLLSVSVRKAIQSIKEIVASHSDAEIYAALKECNMDLNETTQKLLNQDPFHEVKNRKDKKKGNTGGGSKNVADSRQNGHAGPGMKVNASLDRNNQRGYIGSSSAGVDREFRVVKDKQAYPKISGEPKPLLPNASGAHGGLHVSEKGLLGNFNSQKPLGGSFPSQTRVSSSVPMARPPKETSSNVKAEKEFPKENGVPVQASAACVEVKKPVESSLHSTTQVSNNSEVGLYSFSSDPVHVPCSESIISSNVGAIKREIGVVGVRSQLSENSGKLSAIKDISAEHSLSASTDTTEATPQSIKQWKQKSGQKTSPNGPGVIGTPSKSNPSATTDILKTVDKETNQFQDKTKEVDTKQKSNVVFADHIRVAESNSTQLIFGSFGQNIEFSSAFNSDSQSVESGEKETCTEVVDHPLPIISTSTAEEKPSSIDEIHGGKNIDDLRHQPDNIPSRLISQDSGTMNLQDSFSNLSPFQAYYDAHSGYSIPYYRSTIEDNVSSQGLQPHLEALTSSSMVMQQQQLLAQMYPQVHLSHYANLMPYRQYLQSVYVPPTMTIPGFLNNPTSYPPSQSSNGDNSYVLMPGGSSSHQMAVSAASPITGFGNYVNHPTGYAINPSDAVGSAATGLDDLNFYVPNPQQSEGSEMWIQNPRELMGMQQQFYYSMAGQPAHGAYLQSHTGHPSLAQPSHVQFPGLYHQTPLPPPSQNTTTANHHHLVGSSTAAAAQHTTTANHHHLVVNSAAATASPGAQAGGGYQQLVGHHDWM